MTFRLQPRPENKTCFLGGWKTQRNGWPRSIPVYVPLNSRLWSPVRRRYYCMFSCCCCHRAVLTELPKLTVLLALRTGPSREVKKSGSCLFLIQDGPLLSVWQPQQPSSVFLSLSLHSVVSQGSPPPSVHLSSHLLFLLSHLPIFCLSSLSYPPIFCLSVHLSLSTFPSSVCPSVFPSLPAHFLSDRLPLSTFPFSVYRSVFPYPSSHLLSFLCCLSSCLLHSVLWCVGLCNL